MFFEQHPSRHSPDSSPRRRPPPIRIPPPCHSRQASLPLVFESQIPLIPTISIARRSQAHRPLSEVAMASARTPPGTVTPSHAAPSSNLKYLRPPEKRDSKSSEGSTETYTTVTPGVLATVDHVAMPGRHRASSLPVGMAVPRPKSQLQDGEEVFATISRRCTPRQHVRRYGSRRRHRHQPSESRDRRATESKVTRHSPHSLSQQTSIIPASRVDRFVRWPRTHPSTFAASPSWFGRRRHQSYPPSPSTTVSLVSLPER